MELTRTEIKDAFPNIQTGYAYKGINECERIFCLIEESSIHKGYFNLNMFASGSGYSIDTKKPITPEFVKYSFELYLKEFNGNPNNFNWTYREQNHLDNIHAVSTKKFPRIEKTQDIVYFISAGNFIKIGKSTGNPKARIQTLQTGCPYKIEVLGWINGDVYLEKELHKKFSKHKAHGEWFSNHYDITDYLSKASV